MLKNSLVWDLNDFFNYLMVLPNVIALIALSKTVVAEVKQNGKRSVDKTPNLPLDDKIKD